MRVTIVGCGDAFGSGGRLNTCFHIEAAGRKLLIDCGATSLIGMNKLGLDPCDVDTIIISHLHGDHFAGLVWWLVHAQHVARRTQPLTVIGPPTIEQRFKAACEVLFPGSWDIPRRYALTIREMVAGQPVALGDFVATAHDVVHPSGAPSHGLRLDTGRRMLAFSGDTEWTESLLALAEGTDLLILECYAYDQKTRFHLDWMTIQQNLDRLATKRVLLTHMNQNMLDNAATVTDPRVRLAEDGLVLEV